MSIERAGDYIVRVPSDSDANKHYVVDLTPGSVPTCTCVAYAISRNRAQNRQRGAAGTCKHLEYASTYLSHDVRLQEREAEKEKEKVEAEVERIRAIESLRSLVQDLHE